MILAFEPDHRLPLEDRVQLDLPALPLVVFRDLPTRPCINFYTQQR